MLYARPKQAKLASPDVPQHCEAFPSLSIGTADARWHEGQRMCEWYDEQSGIAAQLDLVSYTDHELMVLYSCGADTYRRQRGAEFPVIMHRQNSGTWKPRTRCTGCGLLVDRIYYCRDRWHCQQCHHLRTWRSVLSAEEKLIARHAELIELVHARAADVRSLTKHDQLREELMSIRAQFNGRVPPRIPAPRCHVLTASWFQSDDDRTEREPHDVAPAYLDLPAPGTATIKPA